jgi:hypothetical protein
MRETVIINDGELDQEIGAPYFFQDERITDLNKDQVINLYKHTAIKERVLSVTDPRSNKLYKLQRGIGILDQMVKDMNGDAIGLAIINEIQTQLALNFNYK